MSMIPKGWAQASLSECVDVLDSQRIPVNSDERSKRLGDIPYYGATGQVGWIDSPIFDEELLLVGEDGAPFFDKKKPIAFIISGKSWVNNHAHVLRAKTVLSSNHYLQHYLNQFDFTGYVNGTTRLKLTQGAMNQIPVHIAPIPEQERIVGKLNALLVRVRASQQRLDAAAKVLKRFRRSVLAAACSGKLTGDWRAKQKTSRPVNIRRQILEYRKAARSVETIPKDLIPDEIPGSWEWVSFGSAIGELRNGVSERPEMHPPGTPILRISAARAGTVNIRDVRFIEDAADYIPQYCLRDGDLLFTRYNGSLELLGVCGLVRDLHGQDLLYPDKLMRVRIDHPFLMPEYVEIFFGSSAVHERVVEKAKSSAGQNGVSGTDIKQQPIALPPVEEQREIVTRVAALFAFADRLEGRLTKASRQVEQLTQSILAKAFRGELVLTEAELAEAEGRAFESAEELLKRIGPRSAEPQKSNRTKLVSTKNKVSRRKAVTG